MATQYQYQAWGSWQLRHDYGDGRTSWYRERQGRQSHDGGKTWTSWQKYREEEMRFAPGYQAPQGGYQPPAEGGTVKHGTVPSGQDVYVGPGGNVKPVEEQKQSGLTPEQIRRIESMNLPPYTGGSGGIVIIEGTKGGTTTIPDIVSPQSPILPENWHSIAGGTATPEELSKVEPIDYYSPYQQKIREALTPQDTGPNVHVLQLKAEDAAQWTIEHREQQLIEETQQKTQEYYNLLLEEKYGDKFKDNTFFYTTEEELKDFETQQKLFETQAQKYGQEYYSTQYKQRINQEQIYLQNYAQQGLTTYTREGKTYVTTFPEYRKLLEYEETRKGIEERMSGKQGPLMALAEEARFVSASVLKPTLLIGTVYNAFTGKDVLDEYVGTTIRWDYDVRKHDIIGVASKSYLEPGGLGQLSFIYAGFTAASAASPTLTTLAGSGLFIPATGYEIKEAVETGDYNPLGRYAFENIALIGAMSSGGITKRIGGKLTELGGGPRGTIDAGYMKLGVKQVARQIPDQLGLAYNYKPKVYVEFMKYNIDREGAFLKLGPSQQKTLPDYTITKKTLTGKNNAEYFTKIRDRTYENFTGKKYVKTEPLQTNLTEYGYTYKITPTTPTTKGINTEFKYVDKPPLSGKEIYTRMSQDAAKEFTSPYREYPSKPQPGFSKLSDFIETKPKIETELISQPGQPTKLLIYVAGKKPLGKPTKYTFQKSEEPLTLTGDTTQLLVQPEGKIIIPHPRTRSLLGDYTTKSFKPSGTYEYKGFYTGYGEEKIDLRLLDESEQGLGISRKWDTTRPQGVRFISGTTTASLLDTKLGTDFDVEILQDQQQASDLGTIELGELGLQTGTRLGRMNIDIYEPRQESGRRSESLLANLLGTEQASQLKTRQQLRTSYETTPAKPKLRIPLLTKTEKQTKQLLREKSRETKSYDVMVKARTMYHGKVRKPTVFVKANRKPLTHSDAQDLLGEILDTTSAVSGRLKPSRGEPSVPDRLVSPFSSREHKFTKQGENYIEKKKYRMDSPGELKGITKLGHQANLIKNSRGSKLLSNTLLGKKKKRIRYV